MTTPPAVTDPRTIHVMIAGGSVSENGLSVRAKTERRELCEPEYQWRRGGCECL